MSLFVAPRASTDILVAVGIHTGTTRPVLDCLNQYHVETRDKLTERDKDADVEIAGKRMEASCKTAARLPVCASIVQCL